jgi:hypothetical protein
MIGRKSKKSNREPSYVKERRNTTMGKGKTQTNSSRRRLLKGVGTLLAGGLIGCASTNFSAPSKKSADPAPALPWPWKKIDPMEAGTRAYRYYHDIGG